MPKRKVATRDGKQNGQPNEWISRLTNTYQACYILNFIYAHRQVIIDFIKEIAKKLP